MQTFSNTADAQKRIRKLSRIAELFSILAMIVAIAAFGYFLFLIFFNTSYFDRMAKETLVAHNTPVTINILSRIGVFIVGCVTLLIGMFIFNSARQLFKEFQKGQLFTPFIANKICEIGWAVICLAPATIISRSLNTIILTIGNSAGQKQLSISFNSMDLYTIILGLLILTLGKILHEAAIISDENKSFV